MTRREILSDTYDPLDHFLRIVLFAVMASVGMVAMGLAALAQPLAQYLTDRQKLTRHEQALADLEDLYTQQATLLANAESPAVTERVAINHYRYQPLPAALGQTEPLEPTWPELRQAVTLATTGSRPLTERSRPLPFQNFLLALAAKPKSQNLLLLFGAALVWISLAFFCYRRPTSEH